MSDFIAIPQCLRCGGLHTYAGDICLRDVISVPAVTATDSQEVGFPDFPAPEGWRRIAPTDCIGIPAISMQYTAELQRLAQEQGLEVRAGDSLSAKYRRVDDEWYPIPETLEMKRPPHGESYVDGEGEERCATCDKWLEPGYYDIDDHYKAMQR